MKLRLEIKKMPALKTSLQLFERQATETALKSVVGPGRVETFFCTPNSKQPGAMGLRRPAEPIFAVSGLESIRV
jgi:hypothetical protein